MRDRRFVAVHRGGPLDFASHRLLAGWAQDDEVRFVAASAPLTDEQYHERTRIEPGAGAVTVDMRRQD